MVLYRGSCQRCCTLPLLSVQPKTICYEYIMSNRSAVLLAQDHSWSQSFATADGKEAHRSPKDTNDHFT